ncbi:MAG: T9SS type A sorting domain-containing protein, partial [Carboxylicivirga sp.]|nr:T9SS type A sorting domain-containing protein [Carboxylicivirga sp.]
QLKGHTKGSATITCYSASSPSLTRSFDIVIQDGVPTAITDTKELELALYPNPAINNCRIKGAESARISIYNLSGKLMQSVTNYSADELINLSNFKSGIYIVKIEQNNATKIIKLIKR